MHRRRTKIAPRISAGDSPKNPVLASTDETPSRCPRKFIYCQKPRLRVRATRHRPAKVSRGDLHRASSTPSVNDGNIFSYSIYSDIDIRRCSVFAHFPHRRENAVECRRRTRAHTRSPARQHFLKRDTVFLHVLVYSECVHFDSRVHAAISQSLHRRATWPRKLRRRRRRRAQ